MFGLRLGIYIYNSTKFISWVSVIGSWISLLILVFIMIINLFQVDEVEDTSVSFINYGDPLYAKLSVVDAS